MKTFHIFSIMVIAAILAVGCHNNDDYDSLPQPIATFISNYWPNPDIESYSQPASDRYSVTLKNGPTLYFGEDYSWYYITGNGLPLPEMLVYDQLPEKLYDYIQSGDNLNAVFAISRTARVYKADLLDTYLLYNIETQTVTQE